MTSTKKSKLLLAWLWSNGHEIVEHLEGIGITTIHQETKFRFDLSGSYGGYRVNYESMCFSFFNGDTLIRFTDLRPYEV